MRWRIEDYAGDSEPAQRVRRLARQFAASDATVLIQGDSGTGKELLAQGMHRASRRAAQPFLAVNCAAWGKACWRANSSATTKALSPARGAAARPG